MLRCCQALVKLMKWEHVFDDTTEEESLNRTTKRDWEKWKTDYEPDAGIVNFVRLHSDLGHPEGTQSS